MTTTTDSLADKIEKVADKVSKTAKAMKCKPSHDEQRARIGGGYLVCPTCSEEIPN